MTKKRRGNGEGSIVQRKDGRWSGVASIGIDPKTGKPIRKHVYGKTRKEVSVKLNNLLHEISKGAFSFKSEKITLGAWLDHWMNHHKKCELRITTWDNYNISIECHIKPALGDIPLQKLSTQHIQLLISDKNQAGLSSATIRRIYQIIHGALKKAVESKLVTSNVSDAASLPKKQKRKVRSMTMQEMNDFITALEGHRLQAAYITLLGTGLRRGELLGLRWKNVDIEQGIINVEESLSLSKSEGIIIVPELKTVSSLRKIPLPEEVLFELENHKKAQGREKLVFGEHYKDNDLVFCTLMGTPFHPRNFTRDFYFIRGKAGLSKDINLHALRHTYATRLLEQGVSIKVVQELLGHAKMSTTADLYSHVSPELKSTSVARLDGMLSLNQDKKNSPDKEELEK